ncbi:MAG: hypothetical protein EKK53_13135 [Burkholderiales bacterium]|nr:MAG: hypothetical protein EKK53_13135 [Burkholderiales bacterium]
MDITAHDTDFHHRLARMLTPRRVFDAQGVAHGDIDLRLVQSIEDVLVPRLGHWEASDTWFHQLDFYGDGVRSLTFSRSVFPYDQVSQLQRLLRGEHADFCILCIATDRLAGGESATDDDYLAIFKDTLMATPKLATQMAKALLGGS